ncbi:AzlC family ABC transporter permease [Paenibacillus lutrae]|uniref:Branched-chain amino acid ABC transporter permease n=1 Tax=Paenibacillus lutrae TaxID=2078573 RepID=A0A7X3FJV0_9BACL|nr:branched-chain amino acid ABC transporter permease [Paenibacillus lutrae]
MKNRSSALEESGRESTQEDTFRQGVKDCVPTLLGYWSIGFAAGVVEKTAGMSLAEIALLSLLLYAGSGQFIAAGMIAAGQSVLAIVATIFFVNLRHLLMSAALAPYFSKFTWWQNVTIGSQLTDETFGVAVNRGAVRKRLSYKWMLGLNLTAYLNWFAANMAGGFLGERISDPEQFGLTFALAAMFIGLLVLQLAARRQLRLDLIVAVTAAATVVGGSYVLNPNLNVLAAILVAATAGLVIEKWK